MGGPQRAHRSDGDCPCASMCCLLEVLSGAAGVGESALPGAAPLWALAVTRALTIARALAATPAFAVTDAIAVTRTIAITRTIAVACTLAITGALFAASLRDRLSASFLRLGEYGPRRDSKREGACAQEASCQEHPACGGLGSVNRRWRCVICSEHLCSPLPMSRGAKHFGTPRRGWSAQHATGVPYCPLWV